MVQSPRPLVSKIVVPSQGSLEFGCVITVLTSGETHGDLSQTYD